MGSLVRVMAIVLSQKRLVCWADRYLKTMKLTEKPDDAGDIDGKSVVLCSVDNFAMGGYFGGFGPNQFQTDWNHPQRSEMTYEGVPKCSGKILDFL
ncbi:hypothetical protein IEQ34_014794 [Dendrobium chrysotoxum]|uniref:Uncharacterized protein n=1 Tax=Dendrobium chrysotoxum TaxID=161865 RepID=A0AAV7GMX8_DENCH|nr:hypothetical protein IEQ34_014794 [Dendrobium chrysotoxum]